MAISYRYILIADVLIFVNTYCYAEISNNIDFSGPLPKPVTYFTFPNKENESQLNTDKTQEARFGYPPSGSGIENYGPNSLSHGFYPIKFDVGGLLLGAVVGLGALIVVPKLIHLLVPEIAGLGHLYGAAGAPYGRYNDLLPEGVSNIVNQIEEALSQNSINSSECMQKVICTYVQSTTTKHAERQKSFEDNTIRNSLIDFVIDGSKLKSAVENGKQDVSCSVLYPKCPFTQNSVANGVKQLILNITTPKNEKPYNNKNTDQ